MGKFNTPEELLDGDNKINNKSHRYIFGFMVGENGYCKSIAEAFVEHLFVLESKIRRENNVRVKKKLNTQKNNFLKNYKNELTKDESAMDMLQKALDYCLVKTDEIGNKILEKEQLMSLSINGKYVDRIDRQEYQKYLDIFNTIESLIEQEKNNQIEQDR